MSSPVPPPRRRRVVIPFRPSAAGRMFRPWWFAAAAAAALAFIAYGSFVPFEFQPREWDDATAAFEAALGRWLSPPSKSDFGANIALGVPVGFCLLGALRVDRPRGWAAAAAGLAVAVFCGVYAAGVEFAQLYFRERVCSGADVTAQTLGGLVGVVVWVFAGQWATDKLRRAADVDGVRNSTAPLVVGYAGLLLLIQSLPLDLTASPAELFKRLRDVTTWVPLGELFDRPDESGDRDLKTVAGWVELFALSVPLGLLLAGLKGTFRTADGLFRVAGLGLLAGLGLEVAQVLVESRHPSATDVLLVAAGVTGGWATARVLSQRGVRKWRADVAMALGQAWAAVLLVIGWPPYDFYPGLMGERVAAMNWLPLREAQQAQYLWAAEDLLVKVTLALPLGAVAAWGGGGSHPLSRWVVWAVAVGACGLVAAVVELGQAMQPGRTVCPTDVLLAMAGGWAGAAVTRAVLGARGSETRP